MLPAAVDVPAAPVENLQREMSEDAGSGFLANLFSGSSEPHPTTQPPNESGAHGGPISSSGTDTLTPEQQAQLNAIPDVIGGQPGADVPGDVQTPGDGTLALIEGIEFTPEQVIAIVNGGLSWVDSWLDTEHWKLTDGEANMLKTPYAMVANSLWADVKKLLPGWLTGWADSRPGFMQALMLSAVVFGGKAQKQITISREHKRKVVQMHVEQDVQQHVQDAAPVPRKSPQPSGGIPSAAGIIGGVR